MPSTTRTHRETVLILQALALLDGRVTRLESLTPSKPAARRTDPPCYRCGTPRVYRRSKRTGATVLVRCLTCRDESLRRLEAARRGTRNRKVVRQELSPAELMELIGKAPTETDDFDF
jgi:hypothetical protein